MTGRFATYLILFSILILLVMVTPSVLSRAEEVVKILPGAGDITAQIQQPIGSESTFSPSMIHIEVNGNVTWINNDSILHSIDTLDKSENATKLFESDITIHPGEAYTLNFSRTGTYRYYDKYYPYMTGTVTVTSPIKLANLTTMN